jgi:pilus assembly protein Flp/PilA
MKKLFSRFAKDESGATAIEYGLIAGLIGVVIIAAVTTVGTTISGKFNEVSSALGASSGGTASP